MTDDQHDDVEDDDDWCIHCDAVNLLAQHGMPLAFANADEEDAFMDALLRGQRNFCAHMLEAHDDRLNDEERRSMTELREFFDDQLNARP
jgi:hypothetical protein